MTTNARTPASLPRAAYAHMFGRSVGERIRLAYASLESERL